MTMFDHRRHTHTDNTHTHRQHTQTTHTHTLTTHTETDTQTNTQTANKLNVSVGWVRVHLTCVWQHQCDISLHGWRHALQVKYVVPYLSTKKVKCVNMNTLTG